MKKNIDFIMIREKYNGDEVLIAKHLYRHYYYIVEKVYARNNGNISKKELEEILIKAISKYVCKDYFNCNPSKFIHTEFSNFEKYYDNRIIKEKQKQLIQRAFNNDRSAKEEIFSSMMENINNKASEIYNNYLKYLEENESFSRNQVLFSLDDIKQVMYLEMWSFINSYFSNNNQQKYFSTYYHMQLQNIYNRLNKYIISSMNDDCVTNLDDIYYSDTYFIKGIETSEIIDTIKEELPDKYKIILEYLRKGHTYEYAGKQVGLSRGNANHINGKIKRIVKNKKIEIV